MKGVVYQAPFSIAAENVPDPELQHPNDGIVKITSSCICGSDLHMYEGRTAAQPGIIFGHENMGVVQEVGSAVKTLNEGLLWGRTAETQLDNQRKFITERLENVRAKPDDYRAWAANGVEKVRLVEAIFRIGDGRRPGPGRVAPEQRKEILQMVVEEVIVDRNDNVDITLAIPIDSKPTTEDSVSVQTLEPAFDGHNRHGNLRYAWAVDLGPFKPGR